MPSSTNHRSVALSRNGLKREPLVEHRGWSDLLLLLVCMVAGGLMALWEHQMSLFAVAIMLALLAVGLSLSLLSVEALMLTFVILLPFDHFTLPLVGGSSVSLPEIFAVLALLKMVTQGLGKQGWRIKASPLYAPLFLLVCLTLLSSLRAPDPSKELGPITAIVFLCLLVYMVINVFDSEKGVLRALSAVEVSGTIASLSSLFQAALFFFLGMHVLPDPRNLYYVRFVHVPLFRATGLFGQPNLLGAFIYPSMMIAFHKLLCWRIPLREKLTAAARGATCLAGIVLTFSRGSLVGLPIAALALIFAWRRRIGLAILVAAIIASPLLFPVAMQGMRYLVDLHPETVSSRLELMRLGLQEFISNPVFGSGFTQRFEIQGSTEAGVEMAVHNTYLQVLVAWGMTGLAVLGFLAVNVVWHSFRILADSRATRRRLIVSSLLLSLVMMIPMTFVNAFLMKMFWLVVGLLEALYLSPSQIRDFGQGQS